MKKIILISFLVFNVYCSKKCCTKSFLVNNNKFEEQELVSIKDCTCSCDKEDIDINGRCQKCQHYGLIEKVDKYEPCYAEGIKKTLEKMGI